MGSDVKKRKQGKRFYNKCFNNEENREEKNDRRPPSKCDEYEVRRLSSIPPEYLIRTGSMKSRNIKYEEREYQTLPVSHYASYLLQAGCFFWKGRYRTYRLLLDPSFALL